MIIYDEQHLRTAMGVTLVVIALSLPITLPVLKWIASTIRLKILLFGAGKGKGKDDARPKEDAITVSGIFVHPVKSMRSISLQSSSIDQKGLSEDRRFMVVYELPIPTKKTKYHQFLSQRQCPSLATISATTEEDKGGEKVLVLKQQQQQRVQQRRSVRIPLARQPEQQMATLLAGLWDDLIVVEDLGDEVAAFLQAIVDADDHFSSLTSSDEGGDDKRMVRLVREAPPSKALSYGQDNRGYVPAFAKTWDGGFLGKPNLTDGFPILIASEASLEALNEKLKAGGKDPIPMSRFRPNIVVRGKNLRPFEEDGWKTVVIGDTVFAVVKACPRCKQSCTDQITGTVSKGMEPLSTMRSFRRSGGDRPSTGSVFFAQNAIPIGKLSGKEIRVGDTVRVLETGDPVFID